MSHWQLLDADQDLYERTVAPLLPGRIFDAHVHLYRHEHYGPAGPPPLFAATPAEVGVERFAEDIAWLHGPGRTAGALCFGLTFTGDRAANDGYVAAETAAGRERGLAALPQLIVAPDDDPEAVRERVRRGGFVGLKPYHTLARLDGPTWQASLEAFFPEALARLAHEEGLSVTVHLVRDRALADPANQATLRRYCERYPNMRLILAHAGRGFNPWHTIEGVGALAGLNNLWFDTSAVTEAGGFEAIVETFGHSRLLYGSDFPVSHLRGDRRLFPLALRGGRDSGRTPRRRAPRPRRPRVAPRPGPGLPPPGPQRPADRGYLLRQRRAALQPREVSR
jgi:glutamate-1-semialdehyde 2,1-aminomutase